MTTDLPVQSFMTLKAIALLTAWTAMHGYSERVCAYSRHRPTPKTMSGTSAPTGDDPTWMPPKTIPVMIAAATPRASCAGR
jgi:hypothetical protein